MAEKTSAQSMERAVGRRKTAAARVRLTVGKGAITVNGSELSVYFPIALYQKAVVRPLEVAGKLKNFDVSVKVAGGGKRGQAEAVCHGIARALVQWDEALKPSLRAQGLMTRDPRAKERKKFGKLGARRGHQWRKR